MCLNFNLYLPDCYGDWTYFNVVFPSCFLFGKLPAPPFQTFVYRILSTSYWFVRLNLPCVSMYCIHSFFNAPVIGYCNFLRWPQCSSIISLPSGTTRNPGSFYVSYPDLNPNLGISLKDISSFQRPDLKEFFFRKISPELTSVRIFLCFICGTPATAWLDKWCHVRTQDLNWGTLHCPSRAVSLTTTPPGGPLGQGFWDHTLDLSGTHCYWVIINIRNTLTYHKH